MKLQRTSFGLLIVAALLAGVVAVYEQQQKTSPTGSAVDQPASQRVFDFNEAAIALVTIETRRPAPKPSPSPTPDPQASPSPSPTVSPSPSPSLVPMALTIERVDGQWRLSAPLKVPANPATVAFLTNLLTTTQRDRTLVVSPDRAAEFGLDQPTGTISITLADQKKHQLVLGKPSFDRTFLYALIDPDPQAKELSVSLISPQFANAVDRDLAEWQVEKKVEKTVASPSPEASASPEVTPTATPEVTPAASPTTTPTGQPTPSPSAAANPSPSASPSPQTSPQPEVSPPAKPAGN